MDFDKLSKQIKGFLFTPTKEFRKVRKVETVVALKFAAIGLFVMALLTSLIALVVPYPWILIDMSVYPGGIIGLFLALFLGGFFGIIIGGAFLHIFVYLLGGRKGIMQTIKALAYGNTPSYYLSWIPILGWVIGFWSLIIQIYGIAELHQISKARALVAIILPVILLVVLVVIIIVVVVALLAGANPELLASLAYL